MMAQYLPLLREVLPTAAVEIEDDIHNYAARQGFALSLVLFFFDWDVLLSFTSLLFFGHDNESK